MPRNNKPRQRHQHSRAHVREMADRKRAQRLTKARHNKRMWIETELDLKDMFEKRTGAFGYNRIPLADRLTKAERKNLEEAIDLDAQRSNTVAVNEGLARRLGRRFDRPGMIHGSLHGLDMGRVARLDQRLTYYRFDYDPEWTLFEQDGPSRGIMKQRWKKQAEEEAYDFDDLGEANRSVRHTMQKGFKGRYLGFTK